MHLQPVIYRRRYWVILIKLPQVLVPVQYMPIILNPNEIKDGAEYKILFNSTSTVPVYKTQSFSIIRSFKGVTDTYVPGS